jgi:hypothetical protein
VTNALSLISKIPTIWLAILSAFIIVAFINIYPGTYLESYELLIRQFVSGVYTERPHSEWCTDMDFLLIPLYSWLDMHLIPGYGYDLAKTVYNFIWLSSIVYVALRTVKTIGSNLTTSLLAVVTVLLLCIDHLVTINNVRISIMTLTAGLLYLHLPGRNNYKLAFFFLLVLLGILARIETGVVLACLALIFHLLFRLKKQLPAVIAFTVLSLCIYGFYSYQMQNRDSFITAGHLYEREILDRKNFNAGISDSVERQIKLKAMSYFIQDTGFINSNDYDEAVLHKSYFDYIVHNPYFKSIAVGKFNQLLGTIHQKYLWLCFLIVVLGSFLTFTIKDNSISFLRIRIALFALLYLVTPLLIMIPAEMPDRFLAPYLTAGILVLLFILYSSSPTPNKLLLPALVMLAFFFQYRQVYSDKMRDWRLATIRAQQFEACISSAIDQGFVPVLQSIDFENSIFPRLFDQKQVRGYHVMEYFYLSYFPHVRATNKKLYGPDYGSFPVRVSFLTKPNMLFLSTTEFNTFIADYLKYVHKSNVTFTPLLKCDGLQLNGFKVTVESSK